MDTRDEEWQLGYQCIRFPRTWTGVQRLEVWILDIYPGETEENVICIADVRLSAGDPGASGGVPGNQQNAIPTDRDQSGEAATIQLDTSAYYGPGTD